MKVDKYFTSQYLVAGNTYDNFIFESCPTEFLIFAEKLLSKNNHEVKLCNIKLCSKQQEEIERVFLSCDNDFQMKVIASYYMTTLILKELFRGKNKEMFQSLQEQLAEFKNNNFLRIKKNYISGHMPYDVARKARKLGQKIELNIFLFDMDNIVLQQAINNFISSREPYSVKIFTNMERLSTYYDTNGNLIECPHDFMRRDVNKFIEENVVEKEQ
ncbi:MAG: hypothetical protein J6A28_02770 [Clostridia bacterium]|nr:hypothetical protein [Clostridia bacterium]